MKRSTLLSYLSTGLLTLTMLVLLTNCEVGLGESVDTQRPNVSVVTPASKSVLGGPFTLKGNASDETALKKVTVQLKNIATGATTEKFNAKLESDGSWKLDLNKKTNGKYPIPDGDYVVTVTVYDTADRDQTTEVVYTIDNTAPTVLFTSPTTYPKLSTQEITVYYQQIDIKGEVYDATTLQSVTVYIVDAAGNIKTSMVADGTNTFLASFNLASLGSLTDGGTYYYYAKAVDSAGNVNTYGYHKTDIWALLGVGKAFPSINQIGSLDQGQAAELDNGMTASKLVEKKLSIPGEGAATFGTGVDDPENPQTPYPCVKFISSETAKIQWLNISNNEETSIGIGVPVVGSILPPSDGSTIKPESVTVWCVAKSGETFPDFADANKLIKTDDEWQYTTKPVGSSLNFEVSSHTIDSLGNEGLNWTSGFWKIKIAYTTDSGTEGTGECEFAVSSGVPTLTETGFSKNGTTGGVYYRGYATDTISLSGIAKTSDNSTQADKVVWNKDNGTDINIIPEPDGKYSIPITVDKSGHTNDGEYTYTLTAWAGSLSTTISRVVIIDTKAPTIQLTNFENVISDSTFSIKGKAEDAAASISKLEYSLNGTDWTEFATDSTTKNSFELNVSDINPILSDASTSEYTLWLRASDSAGNISANDANKFNFRFDTSDPVATIDSPTTETGKIIIEDPITYIKGSVKVSGTAHDNATTSTKQADTATLTYTKDGGNTNTVAAGTGIDKFNWNKTAGTWEWVIPENFDSGVYDLTLKVTDIAGKSTTAKKSITIDNTAPTLTTDLEANLNITGTTKKTITINRSDSGVGMSTDATAVTYQINGGTINNVSETSVELTFTQGNNQTVTIKAKDKLGNVATLTKTGINVDTELPSLTSITAAPDYIKKDGMFTFGGTATDNLDLNRIEIVATRDGTRVDQDGNSTTGLWYSKAFTSTTSANSATLAIPTFTTVSKDSAKINGTWKFVITAYDKAGNASLSVTRSFIVNITAPTITEVSAYPQAGVDSNSPFTFRGKASDVGTSGIAKIEYSLDNSTWNDAIGEKIWYVDVPLTIQGSGTFYVRATDYAENVSAVKSQTYVFDTAKPTLTIDGGLERNISQLFTLTGTASDTWQVNTVKITQTKGGTTLTVPVQTITPSTSVNWSTTDSVLPLKATNTPYTTAEIANHSADGTYTYKVTATDAAEKTVESTVTITVDTTAPSKNNITSPESGFIGTKALSGTSYIFRGEVADVGVGVKKLWYIFSKGASASTAPSGVTDYASIDIAGDTWSLTKTLETTPASDGYITTGNLKEGKWYLHVKAEDSAGNITGATSVEFDVDSNAPILSVATPEAGTTYLKKDDTLTLSGKTGDTAGDTTVSVYFDAISETPKATTEISGVDKDWLLTIPNTVFDQDSTKTYSVIVVAKDIFGKTTQETRTVYYDVKAPEVESTSISPVVNVSGTDKVNGTITVNYRISDEDKIASVKYRIYQEATPKTAELSLTKPGSSDMNWNGSFTIDTTTLTDKTTYTIRFTTTDRCGNTDTKDLTINVDQSTDNPVINFTNVDSSYSDFDNGMTNVLGSVVNNKIIGSVTDDDGLTTLKMEISPDKTTWTVVAANLITTENTTSQSFSQEHSKTTEGEYFVRFTATDMNGKKTEKTFWIAVDNGAPVFSAVTPANGNFYATTMAVSGTITDGSKSVTIAPSGDGTSTLLVTSVITTAPTGAAWTDTVTVPTTTGSSYAKTYTATDKYGQTSTYQVTYKVDKDTPTIELTSPDGLSTKYVKQQNIYQFTGTASDTGDSGLSTINYEIKNITNAVVKTGTANNTATWTANIDFNEDNGANKLFPAGNYTITFYAVDKAGNETVDADKKKIDLVVDSDLPQITINQKPDSYTNSSYTIILNATESNIESFKWARTGTSSETGDMTLVSGNYQLDQTALTEGSYTYTFTLTDKAGNSVTETLSTTFDNEAPSISISTPAVNETTTSDTYTLSGTVSDLGSGVKEVKYALKTTNTAPADGSSDWIVATVTGASWKAEGVTLGTTGSEGTFYLFVKATDNLNQEIKLDSRVFYKDLNKPEVVETDVSTTGLITKEDFTLKGRACDTNELSKIEISEGAKTWSTVNTLDDATNGDTSNGFTTYISKNTDPGEGNENWTKKFLVGTGNVGKKNYLADGVHTFTITVTDVAGKTSVIQRTVTVDTVLPTISDQSITTPKAVTLGTLEEPKDWYNKSIIDISANVSDGTGSGVSLLEYSTDNGTSWSSLIKGSGASWTGSVPVTTTSGEMTIYLRAKDAAGNQTGNTAIELRANIDTEAPNTATLGNVDGNPLAGVKLVNKGSNVIVEITAADAIPATSTGIKSVNLKKIGSTTPTTTTNGTFASGKWTVTIDKADLATGGAVFTVTDNAGNSADFTLFQVLVDNTAPTVSIGIPTDADTETSGVQVNGKISLSGTASDDQTLSAVKLYYSIAVTAPTVPTATSTVGWTQMADVTGTYNWSLSNIDTTSAFGTLTDGDVVHLCATAQDSAGNLKASTIQDIVVNQDTDRPEIIFSNITLGATMSSSNYVPLRNSGTVYGTVIDDDGTVKTLEYSVDGTNYTVIPVTNGSWNQNFNDGSQTIRFRVTDAKDKVFTSATSGGPKLTDGTNKYGTSVAPNTLFYLNIDTQNPNASDPTFAVYKTTTGAYTGTYVTDWATTKFGGTNSKLKVKLSASDSNTIASVKATFNGTTYIGDCSDTEHNDASSHDWIISDIPLTGDGSNDLVITVTDGAGLTTKLTKTLALDNTAPVITFIQPSSLISNAETIRGTVDSTSTVYYAISKSGTIEPLNVDVANESTAWVQESNASLSWNVYFDGAEVVGQTHTFMFRDYIWKLGITTEDAIKTQRTYTTITDLYVWIKAVDESGNTTIVAQKVTIDPQGNRPKLTLSYPETDNMTLGGTIRIYGTVTDDVAGKYVWVQIDTDSDGAFTGVDQNYLASKGYTLGDMTKNSTTLNADVTKNGIMVPVNGASWNLTLNSNKEFDPTGGAKTRTLTMWLYATDDDNNNATSINISNVTERTAVIDKDTPVIEQDSLKLVQYYKTGDSGAICTDGTVSTGTVAATQAFVDGMSIKGVWILTGKISDASGIKKIINNGSTEISVAGTSNARFTAVLEEGVYNYTFNIPIGNAISGEVGSDKIEIQATENTDQELNVTKSFSVTYDNKPPVLVTTGENYNINSAITNSNGFYTFGASATESSVGVVNQTGVERIAFYFTSRVTTTNMYDVMIKNGDPGNVISTTGLIKSDGLYWKQATVSSVSGTALTLSAADENIHKGGLAKVNGIIYRIDDLSGTAVTLSGQPGTATTALIAIANVVDNTTAEGTGTAKNDAGYYSDGLYDDGDMMIEKVVKQGTTAIWEANVNSKNIPDGPVTLHYVVFDKAGNYSTGEIADAFVKNNQPRIAGIKIGNDDNGNGIVEDSELVETWSGLYSGGYDDAGRKMTDVTIPNQTAGLKAAITAKGAIAIKPEIVGGNGAIGYTYNVAKNTDTTTWADPYYSQDFKVEDAVTGKTSYTKELGTGSTTDDPLTLTDIELSVKDFLSAGTTGSEIIDDVNQKFSFKIWDSTPGTDSGINSQYATLNVIMNVALRDTEKPTTYINPFYWKSSTDNSLFGNSRDNGHIELPEDLPTGTPEDFNGDPLTDTTIKARRPKVSGKIKIEGIAHDNKLLTSITATMAGFNSGNALNIGIYSPSTATWATGSTLNAGAIPATGWASEITQASYAEMVRAGYITVNDVPKIGATPTDAELAAKVPYISQTLGNTVHWTLYFDTSKVTGVAALNKLLDVSATDQGKPTLSGATVIYTSNNSVAVTGQTGGINSADVLTSQYKMDVVPYITKVTTGLSSEKISNPSVYNRTALGHYPVQSVVSNVEDGKMKNTTSESITLSGFNLNGTTVTVTGITTVDTATAGKISFNVAELKSGKPKITVQGIEVINNLNKNEAKGAATTEGTAYANWYNRQGNGDNNNILTDDIEFDVWEFNDRAAIPLNGLVTGVQMQINQQTKMLNYAFTNGALFYSMAGKVGTTDYSSYYWAGDWDVFTGACVGFHVDDLGYTYSSCSGGDTNNAGEVDTYAMWSSRWGVGEHGTGGTYLGVNAVRLEKIALKTGNGTYAYDLNKNRCLSPEYASSVNGNATNLYHVYYDAICDEIRFRAGTLNTTAKQSDRGFTDEYTANPSSYYGIANCQVIANGTSDTYNPSITNRGAGNYVDIAVAKNGTNDVVCVVWFDAYTNSLKYSYIEDPIGKWDTLKNNASAANWSSVQTIFAEGGEYCKIAVDKNNHIHIAAYAGNGDVKYAYLDTYASAYSEVTNSCIVDASGSVGEHLTLDVAVDASGNSIPYIGYYTSAIKMPKCAYLVNTKDTSHVPAGADENERFTGNWEVATIPTLSRITSNREDKINIGVWKNAGVITDSKIGGTTPNSTYTSTLNAYNSTNTSKTYGNGSSNAVLAYQIANGSGSCIETAQMREK